MTLKEQKTIKIVIFAKAKADRDYLKGQVAQTNSSVLFFENESICFDNLSFFQPDVVIVKTDHKEVVWRFIFAITTLNLNPCLIILSEVLQDQNFQPCTTAENTQYPVAVKQAADIHQLVHQDFQNCLDKKISNVGPLLVGDSETIRNIRSVLPKLKNSDDPILICGESGTGKEYLARLLGASEDAESIFMKIDCHSLSQETSHTPIHFKAGQSGPDSAAMTILIDRIDQACPQVQSELLLLMDDEKRPDSKRTSTPFLKKRFIATTQANLENQARKGTFRQDLFYRLNVIPIDIPPLRERKEDIPLLADYFMLAASQEMNISFMIPSDELKRQFFIYDWPGNVDELHRLVYRVAEAGDESIIQFNGLAPENAQNKMAYLMQACQYEAMQEAHDLKYELNHLTNIPLKAICDRFISQIEKRIMQRALETTNWNRKKAAGLLNISYKSMLNKMKMYEIV